MSGYIEQRTVQRHSHNEEMFAEVISEASTGLELGSVLGVTTVDVSMNGLKLAFDQLIPVGTQLEVYLKIDSCSDDYFLLKGTVVWCNAGNGNYLAGYIVDQDAQSNFSEWQELFTSDHFKTA